MLDNNFPGRRYNDRELAEYMKALRNSAPITLPKLHSKGNYKAWKSEVPLHFEPRSLGDITYGGERYDADLGLRRQGITVVPRAQDQGLFGAGIIVVGGFAIHLQD
ncbi:hypothetical protein PR001_g18364 [Phytophthora rubi]|uniref:Uncharacterized protein n=1 Tax=Phytophthora rubi TaxID=129364 RepID=A0A6A3K4F2_9STRA|nr:hypothetical protein PR001_g18364 [Phytophthora rubi]